MPRLSDSGFQMFAEAVGCLPCSAAPFAGSDSPFTALTENPRVGGSAGGGGRDQRLGACRPGVNSGAALGSQSF